MKKNVIMITIDAFFYEYIGEKNYKKSSTPFLDSLIKSEYVTSVEHMYSEAPYTEAALMSLLGGVDTTDNGSYMKRLSNTNCIFKEFQKAGYETFANCLQSGIYPSGALTGIRDVYYNTGFNFKGCWDYRIKYYKEKFFNNELKEQEKKLLLDILDDNFKEAMEFLKCTKNKTPKVDLIYDKLDTKNINEHINLVNNEYRKYQKNKNKYLADIFALGEKHPIINLYSYPLIYKIRDIKTLKKIEKKYMPIVKKIYRKNWFYNMKNNRICLKKIKFLFKNNKKQCKNYIKGYLCSMIDTDLKDRVKSKTYNSVKTIASANATFEHFKKWLIANNKKPFFAYLHLDDIHFREMFFTHDTSDFNLLDEEFNDVKKYIKNLPKNYKGSISYDLSVQYIDKKIEKLFNFLKENNYMDNTDIIITADHGNSYTYCVPRESYVINFYEENYHIPCLIYTKSNKLKIDQNNFYQTKDIPATILALNNIKIPNDYKGKSMLNYKGRDYTIIEYSGSGCPDIVNRPIFLGVRTKKYKVAGEALLINNSFEIKEVYDLQVDPNENLNLINSIDYSIIRTEINYIKKEINNIKKSNKKILN